VTPESAASLRPSATSLFVNLPDSSRNKMRAAMRDLRQQVSYLGSPFFGMIYPYRHNVSSSNSKQRQDWKMRKLNAQWPENLDVRCSAFDVQYCFSFSFPMPAYQFIRN
jgi:hypothetical protein